MLKLFTTAILGLLMLPIFANTASAQWYGWRDRCYDRHPAGYCRCLDRNPRHYCDRAFYGPPRRDFGDRRPAPPPPPPPRKPDRGVEVELDNQGWSFKFWK